MGTISKIRDLSKFGVIQDIDPYSLKLPRHCLDSLDVSNTVGGLWCGSNAFRVLQPASAGRMREKRYKNYPEISHIKLKQSVSTEPQ